MWQNVNLTSATHSLSQSRGGLLDDNLQLFEDVR